jgi:hypothetical protein
MLKMAERTLYGRPQSILNPLTTPQVDSRDFYPLETLLQAQYVILTTPFQHVSPGSSDKGVSISSLRNDQKVVKVVSTAFFDNWEIAQDFTRVPARFLLATGGVVTVFQRTRPTTVEAALRALGSMEKFIGERPGGQLDWMIVGGSFSYVLGRNGKNTYFIKGLAANHRKSSAQSFVYLGKLPNEGKVTGKLNYDRSRCPRVQLAVKAVTTEAKLIDSRDLLHGSNDPGDFSLNLRTQEAAYLLLNLRSDKDNQPIENCRIQIDHLTVSSS